VASCFLQPATAIYFDFMKILWSEFKAMVVSRTLIIVLRYVEKSDSDKRILTSFRICNLYHVI